MRNLFSNFVSTLRNYAVSSLLNIIGMAVAFAAFYVILTQVFWNTQYNKSIEDADRICLLSISNDYSSDEWSNYLSRPVGERIISSCQGIENAGIVNWMNTDANTIAYIRRGESVEKFFWQSGLTLTRGGAEAIGLKFLSGSYSDMSTPECIGISRSVAEKYHLNIGDVIRQQINGDGSPFTVSAIFDDMPDNSLFSGVQMISDLGERCIDNYSEWSYNFFVKLDNNTDKDSVMEGAASVARELLEGDTHKFLLTSLDELLYSSKVSFGRSGNRTTDISLLAVAILILLTALVNFINFFFALVPVRIRSVNTYKVFGMSRSRLVLNFILESLGLVIISLALAAIMVFVIAGSPLSSALRAPLNISINTVVAVITVAAAILSTAAGSIYPALYITSFQPAIVLKGFSGSANGNSLRSILIGFQFFISITLILCSSFVKLQHEYMMNYDLGFDKEQLLCGQFAGDPGSNSLCYYCKSYEAFETTLRSDPRIKDVAWAAGDIIAAGRMGWGRDYKDGSIYFQCYPVSWNFLEFMGIDIVRGRNFNKSDEQSEGGAIIFNEEADHRYGIDFDASFYGHSDMPSEIAGVCKDFHFKPLQYEGDAFAFYVFGQNNPWTPLTNLYVRTEAGADPFEVMEFIRTTVAQLDPDYDIDLLSLSSFDQSLEQKYRDDRNLSTLMSLFTVIAIIISLMGVFGIVLFDTRHKSREIAVRRVMGAEVSDILEMLNRKYIITVLLCFLIALPVSCIVINRYLAGFANRTPVSWWVFLLTLVGVLSVTVIIVTLRNLNAAQANPVHSLKEE